MPHPPPPALALGKLYATPGAIDAMTRNHIDSMTLLLRHRSGDWGDVDAEDKAANNAARVNGSRILSAYHLKDQTKVWVITEADRTSTCILLPDEY